MTELLPHDPLGGAAARVAVVAHRGSADPRHGVLENTLAAFRAAVELQADGIELDVHRSADGAPVVHHDAEIPGVGLIHQHSVRDLPSEVPLLGAVFAALAPREGFTIHVEIKNLPNAPDWDPVNQISRDVARVLAECGDGHDVVVSSFWPPALEAVRRQDPGVRIALLCAPWMDAAGMLDAARAHHVDAIHVPVDALGPEIVDAARAMGLEVAVWTVNSPGRVRLAASCGVATVMTDHVAMARRALGRPDRA